MRFFYIKALLIIDIFLMPFFGFADEAPTLPSECPGEIEYNIVDIVNGGETSGGDDFIFAGNGNTLIINGGGGSDCILVGNGNMADISGSGNNDVIIVGDANSGEIKGKGGDDIIRVGENNIGNISGEGGNDTLVDGYGSTGVINGGGGIDTIVHVPPAPAAEPVPGTFTSIQHIILSSDGAAFILYVTDDTVMNCGSETGEYYESSISIFSTKTITAIGCLEEGYASPVATLAYTIEKLEAAPADLSSLFEANVFVPKEGTEATFTTEVKVAQNLEIKIASSSGSKVVLQKDTVITSSGSEEFNATLLTSSETEAGSLTGLASGVVVEGALQWGIPSTSLQFSNPVEISIFVGTDLNGETLNIVRSTTGSGDWTSDGIVLPATCVVSDGICTFQATKASYYAVYGEEEEEESPPPQTNNSGGSAGGGVPCHCIPEIELEIERQAAKQGLDSELDPIVKDGPTPEPTPLPLETPSLQPIIEKVAIAGPVVENISESEFTPANTRELEGILQISDDENKGNLMLAFEDTIVYIRTSRDFSGSIGENVVVSISGTLNNFTFLHMTEENDSKEVPAKAEISTNALITENARAKESRSVVASFFASIGWLISRSLLFVH